MLIQERAPPLRSLKQADQRARYFDSLMTIVIVLMSGAKDEMGEFSLSTPGIMKALERKILPIFRSRDIGEGIRPVRADGTLFGKDVDDHALFGNPDMQNPYPKQSVIELCYI
jgi:hypothetical protein